MTAVMSRAVHLMTTDDDPGGARYHRRMEPRHVILVQFATNLLTYAALMRWFLYPRLKDRPRHQALTPLVMFHSIRTLGMFAVYPAFTGPEVAASDWARHVAIGDFCTVILALISVALLRVKHRFALALVWIFSVFGTLDIMNAGRNAMADKLLDHPLGPQAIVIAVGVPALIVTHATIFVLLLRRESR